MWHIETTLGTYVRLGVICQLVHLKSSEIENCSGRRGKSTQLAKVHGSVSVRVCALIPQVPPWNLGRKEERQVLTSPGKGYGR